MKQITASIKKYWKIYLVAVLILFICDSIGILSFNVGFGSITIFPLVLATIIGSLLGPDVLKIFKEKECELGGTLVLVVLAPFMAKMGISAGANLPKLVQVSPALLLQEFGNVGTIILSMPVALLMGLKREAIGACYSINRDTNLGLTTDVYGTESPETQGTFAVYVVGSILGTIIMSVLVSVVISLHIFHPLALGMASGIGSGSMMSAGAGIICKAYPKYAETIMALGSASDVLTGIDGIYIGTFIALPLARKYYAFWEPRIGRHPVKEEK